MRTSSSGGDHAAAAFFKERLNLLIADRDEITLFAERRIAQLSGYFDTIRSATTGLDAFDFLNRAGDGGVPYPDLILFDPDLPVLNGITLLKVLKRSNLIEREEIKLAVISSSLTESQKDAAMALGVTHFLPKPLTEEGFRHMLRDMCLIDPQ